MILQYLEILLAESPSFGLPIMLYDDKCKGAEYLKIDKRIFVLSSRVDKYVAKKSALGKGLSALFQKELKKKLLMKKNITTISYESYKS